MAHCENCGKEIGLKQQYCSRCGRWIEKTSPPTSPRDSSTSSFDQPILPTANLPVLQNWKTSVGATIGGILSMPAIIVLSSLPFMALSSPPFYMFFFIFVILVANVFGLYYALAVYPSYFTAKPKLKNPKTISFLNGFFGFFNLSGFVWLFGVLWNGNLTKGSKGTSNIVYAVMQVIFIIWDVIVLLSVVQ